MSDTENTGSTESRCSICGKPESEVGALVHIPPAPPICPKCLEKEMAQMNDLFSAMMPMMQQTPPQKKESSEEKKDSADKTPEKETTDIEEVEGQPVDKDGAPTDGSDSSFFNSPFGNIGFFTGAGGGNPFGMGGGQAQRKERDPNEPIMAPVPKPHILYGMLDDYVVGQDRAKKTVSVATYNHYKRAQAGKDGDIEIEKSNILLLGPTGTGKTYIIKTLAKLLDVPLAISDATTLTQAGYVGDDIESIISKLISAADGDIERAEHGIVYIDEIDKIAKRNGGEGGNSGGRDIGGESVQQGLLKLLEGTEMEVPLSGGMKTPFTQTATIDTKNILFICGGAFPELDDIIVKRLNKSAGVGFASALKADYGDERDLFDRTTVEDLKQYGMIPEFLGRLPIICSMEALSEEMLYDILTKPHNALLKQYQALLAFDDVDLQFDESALQIIAKRALEQETGARALRAIIEGFMLNIMFEIPKDDTIGSVMITGDYIEGRGAPIIGLRGEESALPEAGVVSE